jgi:NAD(P)-dependent dehydrogenase (short-subunit alcohol dehydrogenase family)
VFTITQLVTPLLEAAGKNGQPARVINIGSVDGLKVPSLETFAYSSSKAGLHHLSRVLANHLGRRNITYTSLSYSVTPDPNANELQIQYHCLRSFPVEDDEGDSGEISSEHGS